MEIQYVCIYKILIKYPNRALLHWAYNAGILAMLSPITQSCTVALAEPQSLLSLSMTVPLSSLTHLLSIRVLEAPLRSTIVRLSSTSSIPSLYHVTFGAGLPLKGILMVAASPAFTVTGWLDSISSVVGSITGGSTGTILLSSDSHAI